MAPPNRGAPAPTGRSVTRPALAAASAAAAAAAAPRRISQTSTTTTTFFSQWRTISDFVSECFSPRPARMRFVDLSLLAPLPIPSSRGRRREQIRSVARWLPGRSVRLSWAGSPRKRQRKWKRKRAPASHSNFQLPTSPSPSPSLPPSRLLET